MKALSLILIYFFFCCTLNAQKKLPDLTEAKNAFAKLYYRIPLKEGDNWYGQLARINSMFFSIDNSFAAQYLSEIKEANIFSEDYEMILTVADSLNTDFINNRGFDSSEEEYEKFIDLLPQISNIVCDCIKQQTGNTDTVTSLANPAITKCYTAYYSNTQIMLAIRQKATGYSTQKLAALGQLFSLYIMSHCKPVYIFSKQTLNNTAAEAYFDSRKLFIRWCDEIIHRLYIQKNYDSLKIIFPNYALYSKQIEAYKSGDRALVQDNKRDSTGVTIIKTYAVNSNKKFRITYQLRVTINDSKIVPVVTKFEIILRDKIVNLVALEKSLNGNGKDTRIGVDPNELPPPQEQLNEKN